MPKVFEIEGFRGFFFSNEGSPREPIQILDLWNKYFNHESMSVGLEFPSCVEAYFRQGQIHVLYADGKEVSFPVSVNRRLRGKADDQLNHIEISHSGLHWPDLDEDLSHGGLRAGRFGQP